MVRARGRAKKRSREEGIEDKSQSQTEEEPGTTEEAKMTEEEESEKVSKKREISHQDDTVVSESKSKSTPDGDSAKFVGFRQIGSRRKNKPRRAAEVGVGVECK